LDRLSTDEFLLLCWAHGISVTIRTGYDAEGEILVTINNVQFPDNMASSFMFNIVNGYNHLWETLKELVLKKAC